MSPISIGYTLLSLQSNMFIEIPYFYGIPRINKYARRQHHIWLSKHIGSTLTKCMDIIFLFVRITCNASKPYLRACLKPYRWWITTIKRPYHRKRTIKIRSLLSSSFQFEHPLWEGNHSISNKIEMLLISIIRNIPITHNLYQLRVFKICNSMILYRYIFEEFTLCYRPWKP